ncbi:MAG: tRNA (adenosine(37)-N6)-threonylcarbamoyltransferase complex transferase subunit TsaD [Alphaproteobacteria bacterium]|nr:tRNA (adenosine(37)-N6)-threonylcarbamoyltransferase complex transferase subunit TsaD [Alphaproteobacteria bacterium]
MSDLRVVLGLETSCDETAAAVVDLDGIRSDVTHSQTIHDTYGGVVPELAARAHVEKVSATVRAALAQAGIARPDAVVATAGPGLVGAVLVGLCQAKALAAGWDVPFLGVNHLEGHLLSARLGDDPPDFPFLALVVSGGHTTLYRADGVGDYTVLGQTVDDAAGEAFDKVARMLGLGYPGGPRVDALAARGDPQAVVLPRPLPGDLDFSFSGLKTAVRTHLLSADRRSPEDVCAGFQAAVVDCLVTRVTQAAERTGIPRVALGGGVAANRGLREGLRATGLLVHLPSLRLCTDNAAMIAHAGLLRLRAGQRDGLDRTARPRWPVGAP